VADWDRAVDLSPTDERPPRRLSRAFDLAAAGHTERAVSEADDLARQEGWDAGDMYNLACVYAWASAAQPVRAEPHAAAAVGLLRRAVAAGYRNRAHMEKDPDLDPLRGRADFRKLLASLPELALKPRPAR
jgi:hypothetical protein